MVNYIRETFKRGGWREEVEVYYRQRYSVWFVFALMILMSVFWTRPQAWVAFFLIMAGFSAYKGIRVAVLSGLSFATWFFIGTEGWLIDHQTTNRIIGLWCIGTLFLLVVWKADSKYADSHNR